VSEFVTLPQTRLVTGDDVDRSVIDEFTKNNYILANIPFHRAAAPSGGDALAYTYTRVTTQPDAAFRALGSDYTKSAAEVAQYTVTCKVLGGSFGIDRVLAAAGAGSQVAMQISQKVKGAQAAFNDAVINGDSASDANSFDGLSVALTGSSTEIDGTGKDWTNSGATTAGAFAVLEDLDSLLSEVDGTDGIAILGNKQSVARIRNAARIAGYATRSEDAAGRVIDTYNGVPIVDLGAKAGSNDPVIATANGTSDVYVVRFALDGFHAVAPASAPIVTTKLPDPNQDSPVLTGWVEMVSTVALKATKAAAVLRTVSV